MIPVETGRVEPDVKARVREYWEANPCGDIYAIGGLLPEKLDAQAEARFKLEPYIPGFARFDEAAGRDVLEVGVGIGADHLEWAKSGPRSLAGLDLTEQGIGYTHARLDQYGLRSSLLVGDAENLPFDDQSFDIVYSWGVLHHTPEPQNGVNEILRVLRPGGVARVMVYQTYSIVGCMLYARYGLLAGHPWRRLRDLYAQHLESPGTKTYSVAEARRLFSGFASVAVRPQLSYGDLLKGSVGRRHAGPLLATAKALWPAAAIERLVPNRGLYLLIEATK